MIRWPTNRIEQNIKRRKKNNDRERKIEKKSYTTKKVKVSYAKNFVSRLLSRTLTLKMKVLSVRFFFVCRYRIKTIKSFPNQSYITRHCLVFKSRAYRPFRRLSSSSGAGTIFEPRGRQLLNTRKRVFNVYRKYYHYVV